MKIGASRSRRYTQQLRRQINCLSKQLVLSGCGQPADLAGKGDLEISPKNKWDFFEIGKIKDWSV